MFLVLKFFKCPVKFNKSALKAPGTPHSFPSVLAVMHWLVQVALYNDQHVVNSTNVISNDSMFNYSLSSYLHYIAGDDDAVDREDAAFTEKFESELNTAKEKMKVKAENAKELERKLEAMRSGPSLREIKEEEKSVLEKDLKKFNDLIEQLKDHEERAEKQMEEKEKALGVKVEERSRICAENEELKKKVEEQGFNMRDAERMKRELQAVERDIGEAEIERNKWEEKCWDLNAVIGAKWKDLEALQLECNQAIRRLKLGKGFQYELNAKGSTPIEVLGDYKSTLKPGLNSSIEEVKRTKMESLESKVRLQQVSSDIAAKIKAKENRIAILQSRIDELTNQISATQKGTQDYISSCEMEARRLQESFEAESRNVDLVEKKAHEFLDNAKASLQEATVRGEKEVQMCTYQLLALIDSISKYKEFTTSKISQVKNVVSETAAAITQVHNDSLASSSIGTLP